MLALLLAAAAAAPLSPSGPWNVEYSENMCVLSRPYGTGADRIFVGFQPLFNAEKMDVIVLGDSKSKAQRIGDAKIVDATDGTTFDGDYTSVMLTTGTLRFTRITVPAMLFDRLGGVSALTIKAGPIAATILPTKFDKALPVFRRCQAELLKTWGVDPSALDKDRAPKAIDAPRHFSASDYPNSAVGAGIIGRVTTVLNVDATGVVTDCRVVASAGPALNAATCKKARFIRYQPATDRAGHPAPAIDVLTVRWVLP